MSVKDMRIPDGYNHLVRSLEKGLDYPVCAIVQGNIPEWLNGTLFRNGPGKFHIGDKTFLHMFDGFAVVHKFTIKDKKVTYFNRVLETECLKRSVAENRLYPVYGETSKETSVLERLQIIFKMPRTYDNTNGNILPFAFEHLYALGETNRACRISPKNFEILETVDIHESIPSLLTNVHHPHLQKDGGWITCGMNLTSKKMPHHDFVRYIGMNNASGSLCKLSEPVASIPSTYRAALSYVHSFAMTENYTVLIEQPMIFNLKEYLKCLITNKPYSNAVSLHRYFGTPIRVINRFTGRELTQSYFTDSFICYHIVNAYETSQPNPSDPSKKDKFIFLDLCIYDINTFDVDKYQYNAVFAEKHLNSPHFYAKPSRIVIPLDLISSSEISCSIHRLNPRFAIEFPTFNSRRFNQIRYKYMYGVNFYQVPYSIVKINVDDPEEAWEKKYSNEGVRELPSEPVFVENPNPTSEDDGVLLVMILSDKHDYLSILDAKNLEEIARAELPSEARGAFTYHGFFADAQTYPKLNQ